MGYISNSVQDIAVASSTRSPNQRSPIFGIFTSPPIYFHHLPNQNCLAGSIVREASSIKRQEIGATTGSPSDSATGWINIGM